MGIILASSNTYLKKYKGHSRLNYRKIFITKAIPSIRANSILDKEFIYSSNLPIFVLGSLEFILALVYLPVKMTIPVIWPAANTVFAQAVLSNPKD